LLLIDHFFSRLYYLMSKTVNTQSKSQRIKATKKHLKNVGARVDELREMMELFNKSTDLGEMYKSIKTTVIDPICHDIRTAETTTPTMFDSRGYKVSTQIIMGNPGSNKFCKQHGSTLSKCSKMLLKIAGILMPIFHSIGMNVWLRELKAIKKPAEQYKTLCKLFADAETKINSLPKSKKNVDRRDRLALRINGLVKDYDPDFQFMLSGILHMKMTTGKSDQELLDYFLSDVKLPKQTGGGHGEDDYYGEGRSSYERDHHRGREYQDDRFQRPRSPPPQARIQPPPLQPTPLQPQYVAPSGATREERLAEHRKQQLHRNFVEEQRKRLAMIAELDQTKTAVRDLWIKLGMANPAFVLSHEQKLKHAKNIAITQQKIFAKVGGYFEVSKANMFIVIGTISSTVTLYMMGAMPAVMSALSQAATMGKVSGDGGTIDTSNFTDPTNMTDTGNGAAGATVDPYGNDWTSYKDWKQWSIYGASSIKSAGSGAMSSMYSAVVGPTTTLEMLEKNRTLVIAVVGLFSVALIAQGITVRAMRDQEGKGKIISAEAIGIALDGFNHAEQGMGRCWHRNNYKNENCPIDQKYYSFNDEAQKGKCLSNDGCQWLGNSEAFTILMSYIDELDDTARGYYDIEDLTTGQLQIKKDNKELRQTLSVLSMILSQINQTMLSDDNLAERLIQLDQQTNALSTLASQQFTDASLADMMQNPITSGGLNAIMAIADRRMQNEAERSAARKQLFAGLGGVALTLATGGSSSVAIAAATSIGIKHATTTADNEGRAARNEMTAMANVAAGAAGLRERLSMEPRNQELLQAYGQLGDASGAVAAAALNKAGIFTGTALTRAQEIVGGASQITRRTGIRVAEGARHVGEGLVNAIDARRAKAVKAGVPMAALTQREIITSLEEAHQVAQQKLNAAQQRKVDRTQVVDARNRTRDIEAQIAALQEQEHEEEFAAAAQKAQQQEKHRVVKQAKQIAEKRAAAQQRRTQKAQQRQEQERHAIERWGEAAQTEAALADEVGADVDDIDDYLMAP
jgi:hypothetical protein